MYNIALPHPGKNLPQGRDFQLSADHSSTQQGEQTEQILRLHSKGPETKWRVQQDPFLGYVAMTT